MRWDVHVAHKIKMRNACKILVGKSEAKRPLERPSSRSEDNIRMDVREIELEVVDLIHMA
jgi:hypothetical protein